MSEYRTVKFRLPYETKPREGDSDEMIRAIEIAVEVVGRFVRPTAYQIKVNDVNYYPSNGTLLIDGQAKSKLNQSLDDFRALISKTR